jgi:hypothetical protein
MRKIDRSARRAKLDDAAAPRTVIVPGIVVNTFC